MNKKRYELLKEKAESLGKKLLIEEVIIDSKIDKIIIEDKVQFKEDSTGQTRECRGILKNVPVTRYTENQNSRIYPKSLWARVAESGAFTNSDCYADHAEDEPQVDKIVGIWGPLKINEETANADLHLIGERGQLMLEKVKALGRVGFSTVGFGTLSEDNEKVVNDEDYSYQNTDWVHSPSQAVYATKENLFNPATLNTGTPQEKQKESNIFENKITNNKIIEAVETNSNKQIKQEVVHMDKIHESAFKNQINKALKEAVKNENILEAIDELNCLDIPIEYSELKEKKESTISNLQAKLAEQKTSMEKVLVEKEVTYKELKEKYDVQNKTLEGMKEKFLKLQEALKKNGIGELGDVNVLKENVKKMKEDIDILLKERNDMAADIKIFEDDTKARDFDIKKLKEKYEDSKKMNEDIKMFEKERKDMLSDIKEFSKRLKHAEAYIANLRNRLKEEGVDDEDVDKLGEIPVEEDAELETVEGDTAPAQVKEEDGEEIIPAESVKEDNELVTTEGEIAPDQVQEDDEMMVAPEEEAPVMEDNENLDEPVMTEEDMDVEDFAGISDGSEDEEPVMTEDADDDKMAAVRAAQDGGDKAGSSKKEEDEAPMSVKAGSSKKAEKVQKYQFFTQPKQALKEKKVEVKKPVVNKDIVNFLESQVKKTPFLKNFEKQILASKSLLEAVNKVEKIKEQKEDKVVKMSDQEVTTWVPKGRW